MNVVPDLHDRNIGAVFDLLDADGDGVITAADVSAMAVRFCDALAITGTEKGTQFAALWASWWEQVAADADADGDGRISREEFAAALLSGRGDPAAYFREQLGRMAAAEAEALDKDGDGYIEQADYAALFAVLGLPAETGLAGFSRLDADHDGKISTGEFVAGIADLFLSHNPADPGTAMIGQT